MAIHEQANKGAVWFLVGSTSAFGAMAVLAGGSRLVSRLDGDAVFLFVMGLACLILAGLFWRFYFKPRLKIGPNAIVVRRFWGRTVTWSFDDVSAWRIRDQLIERDWRRRRLLTPITVEYFDRIDRGGEVQSVVLPGFAGRNEEVLATLAKRSGVPIKRP